MSDLEPRLLVPDSSGASLLHRLVSRRAMLHRPGGPVKIYLGAIAVLYLPLLAAARLSPLPIWSKTADLSLPFLRDANIAFTFLVSVPILVILLVTDEKVLRASLQQVQEEGIVSIDPVAVEALRATWNMRFRVINLVSQIAGIGVGLLLSWVTANIYFDSSIGFWIASEGHLVQPVGAVYLMCITVLYAIILLYVVRSVAISIFLADVVKRAEIRMFPFHPDKCGGLSPVGRLGLRNQYTLTVLGLNIAILALMSIRVLNPTVSLYTLLIAATAAYVILGPVVFVGPLLPFRNGMLRARNEWARDVASVLRVEVDNLRTKVRTGRFTSADAEALERLQKLGGVIDELPVWPFDSKTLRRFGTAYALPLGVPLLLDLVKWLQSS